MTLAEVRKKCAQADGMLSAPEVEFLYETARRAEGRGVILEIGSWQGKSTICLAGGSLAGNKVPVFAVDPHQNSYVHLDFIGKDVSTFDIFQKNLQDAGVRDMVTPIVKKSEDAVKEWSRPIEFLWIDGDHRYSEVKKDLDLWLPFVVDGGTVAFHDSTCDDVQSFVLREVFPSGRFRKARLLDSITAFEKTPGASSVDGLRKKYVAGLIRTQSALRRLPVPAKIRRHLKTAAKKVMLALSR